MTRIRARRPRNAVPRLSLALGALALGALSSCDNPACVFGPNVCQTLPGGGANAVAATFPDTGELVIPGGPRVEAVFPTGFAHPESPVVLVFSESISPSTVQDAFTVRSTSGFGGGGGAASTALVGDGRVLILIPSGLVPGQEFEIAYTESASVRDLSGALALQPADGVVGSFTVDDDPSETPQVLMTWPFDGATGVSTITEVVTVFNRVMDPTTFAGSGWDVKVNGLDPAFDPLPEAIEVAGSAPGGGANSDSRVWRWRSVDTTTGARQHLGDNVPITVDLSVGPQSLTTLPAPGESGVPLAATTITATTAGFAPPATVEIMTDPTDAIGIENLNGVNPLVLEVNFEPLVPVVDGDVLEIFLVGSNPDDDPDAPNLISLQRELPLSGGAAISQVNADDLALTTSTAPLVTRFAEGDVSLAFAVRRGDARSALRVLDVDATTDGIQDALLDITPPSFLNVLGLEEGESVYRSDLRELALAGFASEEPRSVELVAMLSGGAVDNRVGGQLPPLPAFNLGGAFVAAPIDLGIVPRSEFPLDVSVIVYDRALNASAPFTLQYTQRAGSGDGTLLPGSGLDVEVTVFDQSTLEPIVGATVYANETIGGVVGAFTASAMTDANGFTTIGSSPTGDTILTVEAAGYDLFTFQSVPTTRLDVPLTPIVPPLGAATVVAAAEGEALSSPFIESRVADSRLILPGETTALADACTYNVLTNQTTCSFLSPLTVRGLEAGLLTFLATKAPNDLNDPDAFSAGTFLQAFELNYPRTPLQAASVDNVLVQVGELLSGAGVPPGDVPLGTAPQLFSKPPNYSLDFANPSGAPRVSVEAFTNGIRGVMTVGLGVPYFDGFTDTWDIRAAYSARARAGGELASRLAIEDERLLRVEVVDASGNRSGVRQSLSTATGALSPPGVPDLSVPTGTTTAGDAYDLVYENVLLGSQDGAGLYHALLIDSTGRRWHLWTPDPLTAMGPTVTTHVPPISAQGGTPLASGQITCYLDAWSWEGFDAQDFLFSDIVRRHDRFTSASPKMFSQP